MKLRTVFFALHQMVFRLVIIIIIIIMPKYEILKQNTQMIACLFLLIHVFQFFFHLQIIYIDVLLKD